MCQNNRLIEVVLTYDMITTYDPNINNEIKRILLDLRWRDYIVADDGEEYPLPSTTLVARCRDLDVAESNFGEALRRYNENHPDNPAEYSSAVIFEKGRSILL